MCTSDRHLLTMTFIILEECQQFPTQCFPKIHKGEIRYSGDNNFLKNCHIIQKLSNLIEIIAQ